MRRASEEPLPATAVLVRSIKVFGWQLGAGTSREHLFQKKRGPAFLKIISWKTNPRKLQLSETKHMVFTECLLARAKFARSIKMPR